MTHLETALSSLLILSLASCANADAPEAEDVSDDAVLSSTLEFDGNPHIPTAYDGEYESTVIMLALERSIVERLLPPELELDEQPLTDPWEHPLYVLHNRFSRLSAPGLPDVAYDEYAAYVPFVRLADGFSCGEAPLGVSLDRPSAFMPILFLNHPQPTQIGVDYYGFNKHLTTVTANATTFEVSDPTTSARIYRAEFGRESPLTRTGRHRIRHIQNAWANTLIGKSPTDGTMIWSGLQPDLANATYTSVEADIEVEIPSLGRIAIHRRGINQSPLGTWRVRTTLIGSIPVPCGLSK